MPLRVIREEKNSRRVIVLSYVSTSRFTREKDLALERFNQSGDIPKWIYFHREVYLTKLPIKCKLKISALQNFEMV